MKLASKILVFIIFLVFLTGALTGITTIFTTEYHFERYLSHIQDQRWQSWQQMLTAFYQQQGNWDKVGEYFDGISSMPHMGRGPMWGQMGIGKMNGAVVLTDSNGKILLHPDNGQLGKKLNISIDRGKPIFAPDQTKVGYVFPGEWFLSGLTELEATYKAAVTHSVMITTTTAIIIALVLGVFLSKKITAPLQQVTKGIKRYKNGEYNYRLQIPEEKELAELAIEFNSMADTVTANIKSRQNLVADVAHELRTPLTIMNGKLETALEKEQPLALENVASLTDEVMRLNKLVGDLQKLSLVDAGKVELNIYPIDISIMLKEMSMFFAGEADARDINFTLQIAEENIIINSDKDRLKQVLLNLVNNAFQHTDSGGEINIKTQRQHNQVQIIIKDSGKGIAEEDLPNIFERFYRAEKSRNRATGGMGLGLAIAKGYIEALGGTIRVESQIGQGTTFIVGLPTNKEA